MTLTLTLTFGLLVIEGLRSKRRVKRFRVEVEIGLLSNRTLTHVQRLQVEITQVSSYNRA